LRFDSKKIVLKLLVYINGKSVLKYTSRTLQDPYFIEARVKFPDAETLGDSRSQFLFR